MAKWFTLREMTKSETAKKHGLDNTPSFEVVDNLKLLVDKLLDPVRDGWGGPVTVTSGYRCEQLNKLVGGVANSQHMRGEAADIVPGDGQIDKFITWIRNWIKDKDFDQCIIETSKKTGGKWVHISFKKSGNRRKLFNLEAR